MAQASLGQRRRRLHIAAGAGAILGLHAAATAQFSGPYAPANWTFNANGGDGSVDLSGVPDEITLIGNDNGQPLINTDYTVIAAASGLWSFDWEVVHLDTGTYDTAYYLINGVQHFINDPITHPHMGSFANIPLSAGDVIGFRVHSSDGALGELLLTIRNFNGPVPSPGAVAPLIIGAGVGVRRSRGATNPLGV